MKNKFVKKWLWVIIGIVVLLVIDQFTKYLAYTHLNPAMGGATIPLWEGVFSLFYLENRGAAFGIMQGQKPILIVVTSLAVGLISWFYAKVPVEKKFLPIKWIYVFLMAGALGNFIDRIRLNFVIDFFYFELINFPVFNMADVFVSCSVAVLMALFLFYYKEEDFEFLKKEKEKKE